MMMIICTVFALTCHSVTGLKLQKNQEFEAEVVPEFAPLHTQEAIQNVNSGTGSIWLFHTTHNAGTSLLALFRQQGFEYSPGVPSHGGCYIEETDLARPKTLFYDTTCGEDGLNVPIGEFGKKFSRNSDKLLTVYPIRHPVHRNLAGDGMGGWQQHGSDACFTDNYGLRKLIGLGFDVPLTQEHIDAAKARAASFDIVMDMTNFTEGLETLCGTLGWSCQNESPTKDKVHQDKVSQFQEEHADVYKEWVERNAPEIAFYEYTKKLAQTRLLEKLSKEQQSLIKSPGKPIQFENQDEQTQWLCPLPQKK